MWIQVTINLSDKNDLQTTGCFLYDVEKSIKELISTHSMYRDALVAHDVSITMDTKR